jgi:nitrite reductase (NO-forming)
VPAPATDRVPRAQAQARASLRTAAAVTVAAAAAGVTALAGASRWAALHLALAGSLVLTIGGVTLLLTVTWSAAPAPDDRRVDVQRAAIVVGAVGLTLARGVSAPDLVVGAAGAVHLAGLVLLGVLLAGTVRRGSERRFDVAVASYVAAIASGVAAGVVGATMATGHATPGLRSVHVTLNLLGLVGLVVSGSVPFFAATVVRSRMSPRAAPRPLAAVLAWQVAALLVAVAGLGAGRGAVASAGLFAYAAGVLGVLLRLPGPTARQLEWAGPRLVAVWAGVVWWAVAVAATAVEAASAPDGLLAGRWLGVLLVAGYGQIVWGSLAYLVPMLRGGGPRHLGSGFATTRSWVAVALLDLAGLGLALGAPAGAVAAAVVVVVADTAVRLVRVGLGPAPRPDGPGSAPPAG